MYQVTIRHSTLSFEAQEDVSVLFIFIILLVTFFLGTWTVLLQPPFNHKSIKLQKGGMFFVLK